MVPTCLVSCHPLPLEWLLRHFHAGMAISMLPVQLESKILSVRLLSAKWRPSHLFQPRSQLGQEIHLLRFLSAKYFVWCSWLTSSAEQDGSILRVLGTQENQIYRHDFAVTCLGQVMSFYPAFFEGITAPETVVWWAIGLKPNQSAVLSPSVEPQDNAQEIPWRLNEETQRTERSFRTLMLQKM